MAALTAYGAVAAGSDKNAVAAVSAVTKFLVEVANANSAAATAVTRPYGVTADTSVAASALSDEEFAATKARLLSLPA